jgi:hypothetical protein
VKAQASGKKYKLTLEEQGVDPANSRSITKEFTVQQLAADFIYDTTAKIGFTTEQAGNVRVRKATISSITLKALASGVNYDWSVPPGEEGLPGCSIPGPKNQQEVALSIQRAGTCKVKLSVSNNGTVANTSPVTIGSTTVFSNVVSVLSACTGSTCHDGNTANAPSWKNEPDEQALRDRLNTMISTQPESSKLLVCASTGDIGSIDCATKMLPNQPRFGKNGNYSDYDRILTWIINGQP